MRYNNQKINTICYSSHQMKTIEIAEEKRTRLNVAYQDESVTDKIKKILIDVQKFG